jgi:hypothetical protein
VVQVPYPSTGIGLAFVYISAALKLEKKTILSCVRTFRCMGWSQEASAAINGGIVDEYKTYGLIIPLIHDHPSRTLPLDSSLNSFFSFACGKFFG